MNGSHRTPAKARTPCPAPPRLVVHPERDHLARWDRARPVLLRHLSRRSFEGLRKYTIEYELLTAYDERDGKGVSIKRERAQAEPVDQTV